MNITELEAGFAMVLNLLEVQETLISSLIKKMETLNRQQQADRDKIKKLCAEVERLEAEKEGGEKTE
jgi:UDP-N-acetylglucosamine enolpyruvyl transferase